LHAWTKGLHVGLAGLPELGKAALGGDGRQGED